MPKDKDFTIHKYSTAINKWTKKKLLKALGDQKTMFHEVWTKFLVWLKTLGFKNFENIYLCAYNGFHFDFKVIVNELRRFDCHFHFNF